MPKGKIGKKTGTVHHCPGRKGPVNGPDGKISAGNCKMETDTVAGVPWCRKHQQLCPQGCGNPCMLSQEGCVECEGNWKAQERAEAARKEKEQAAKKKNADEEFFNPPKERRKPRKDAGDGQNAGT